MAKTTDAVAAEFAITGQMNRFFGALDRRDFEAMAAIMTPNAVWRRGGVDLQGREALLAAMAVRPDDRHSCHLLSNQTVTFETQETAVLTFYSVAWVHVGPVDAKGIAPLTMPSSIGDYTARFAKGAEGWQLTDLRSIPRFRKEK
ncbi:MAG: nuclear transport factor 2 family protein [Rhodobacteraceae bacterium]|jgi:hypothetical protein|nr:nuclear transport factor 2 family protein [Paracoccaceae bacterium]